MSEWGNTITSQQRQAEAHAGCLRAWFWMCPGPAATRAAPRQGVVASANDANHLVPATTRTIGQGQAMPTTVRLLNQSKRRVIVGNPDISVCFQVRRGVVF
jgi:hypothetical protein